jgi:hypothetical protein
VIRARAPSACDLRRRTATAATALALIAIPPDAFADPPPDEPPPAADSAIAAAIRARAERAAQRTAPPPPFAAPAPETFRAGVDLVAGFGNVNGDKITVGSALLCREQRRGHSTSIMARWPISMAAEGGDPTTEAALGNLEIDARYHLALGPRETLHISFGVAVPTATGDALAPPDDSLAVREAAVNQAAAESRGDEFDALFAPHHLGVVPEVELEARREAATFGLFTKVDAMGRTGGADASGTTRALPIAAEWVTGGSFFFEVARERFAVGTRAWFSYAAGEPTLTPGADAPTRGELVLEPGVWLRAGRFRGALSYLAPVPGPFGGARLVAAMVY